MMTLHGGEKEEDVVVVIASTIPPGKEFSYFGHENLILFLLIDAELCKNYKLQRAPREVIKHKTFEIHSFVFLP